MKKRGVLSLWKSILLVIAGLCTVAGVTVLTLFLMGRFDKSIVEPENMDFSQSIADGEATFNAATNSFEVSSDFKMTIGTSTEGATETKVTLSLRNGQVQDDYITDGIIKVPREVNLNKPFEISLVKEYNSSIYEDWCVGGTSVLTAKSSNVLLPTKTITICVDVPVYDIDVQVAGSNQTGETQEVVVGTAFSLNTKFTPNSSAYLFNDDARQKKIFYSLTSSFISYDWENDSFYANTRSGNNTDTISVYTFANSYYQQEIMSMFENITDAENLTASILGYYNLVNENGIRINAHKFIVKEIKIKVLDIDVESVNVEIDGNSLNGFYDKTFTLTASSTNGDRTLGLAIKDSKGQLVGSLNSNFGIKIPKNNAIKITGGKIMNVVSNATGTTITQENYDKAFDYAGADEGTEYYVLPNMTPKNYADYYWQISAVNSENTDSTTFELTTNFFTEDENGQWQMFFASAEERKFNFVAQEHDEQDPAWTNETISLTINFDESGNPKSSSKDLAKDLNAIDENNIYRTVRYFLFIDTKEMGYAENIDMLEVFNCFEAKTYTKDYKGNPLTIPGTQSRDEGYAFYEIDGDVLVATKSFAGKVKVVACTIKTDVNNNPYLDDGKYVIVKASRVRDIVVDSSLSIANMTPTYTISTDITANVDKNNDFYIPAINRNDSGTESGNAKTMVKLELVLNNSENVDEDSEKVARAFDDGSLKIVCLDRNGLETNSYLTLQGLTVQDKGTNSITFEGAFAIEEGFFSAGKDAYDKGTYIKLQLQYNDGKEVRTKNLTQKGGDKDYFFIYYQQPVSMTGAFEDQQDLFDKGNLANINVKITASDGIEVTWGSRTIAGETTEEIMENLNDLLTFTLTDQFGNEINNAIGLYKYQFVETPTDGTSNMLISFDNTLSKIQNFVSTQGKEKSTTLIARILNEDGDVVYKFDENGRITDIAMVSQVLTFDISSEGLSKVEYDFTTGEETGTIENKYKESESKSAVTVNKYVTSDNTFDMNTLIRVYRSQTQTGGQVEDVEIGEIIFKLDNTFLSSMSESNKIDIMKMIQFNVDAGGAQANAEETTVVSMNDYKDVEIKNMKIINPFKEDTKIVFSVTDKNQSLFDITLNFVCKSDISLSQSFGTYQDKNSKYLVTKGNAVSVFAGEVYDLDEYIVPNSNTQKNYSWVKALSPISSLESDQNGVFYENQKIATLSKDTVGGATKIRLHIDEIYQFKTVTFTLYYGINSFYACSITITLYVNPNLVVRQISEKPFVKLDEIGSAKLSSSYKLYKITEYIQYNESFDECTDITQTFEFVGISATQYIEIKQNGIYNFVNNSNLDLMLGETINQTFKIVQKNGDAQKIDVYAIRIVEGDEKQIILCDEQTLLTISIEIGLGEGNEIAQNLLLRKLNATDSENVDTLMYDGVLNVLLLPGSVYIPQDGFTVCDNSATGELSKEGTNITTSTSLSTFMSVTGNSFKVKKPFLDNDGNNLEINITINAIISSIGKNFVYYTQSVPENADNMIYNTYGNVDFKTLIGNYTDLENAEVAQSLQAGKSYTIIHDSLATVEDLNDAYGFYYDSDATGITETGATATYTLSIVEEAQGYVEGLAKLEAEEGKILPTKLVINHLEKSYDSAYVVLRLQLQKYQGGATFTWYYRIKVEPSFTVGKVEYPYADGGEYLDSSSQYYQVDTGEYIVPLAESFNAQNSADKTGKRFGDVNWESESDKTTRLTAQYQIISASVQGVAIENSNFSSYFIYHFDELANFTVKLVDSTAKISLTIQKTLYNGEQKLIGSEMTYIFKFNQSSNYVHSVKENGVDLTAHNNNYSTTIKAGSGEQLYTASIWTSNNGTQVTVSNYDAYIAGDNIENALQNRPYLKAGATYYNIGADDSVEDAGIFENHIVYGEWQNEKTLPTTTKTIGTTTYYNVSSGGTSYWVTKDAIAYSFAYMDADKVLSVKPQANVDKDYILEIGYYSNEKVIFKINLTVTSYFTWQFNDTITYKGGQKYSFANNDETNIFSSVEAGTGREVTNMEISLKNGDEPYSYKKTSDTELGNTKTYYTYNNTTKIYEEVETPSDSDLSKYYEIDLTIGDLVKIVDDSTTWKKSYIEFAHLLEDTTFEFTANITSSAVGDDTYSFNFSLTVLTSFDTSKSRTYTDVIDRYGNLQFVVEMDTITTAFNSDMATTSNVSYVFSDGNVDDKTTINITPNNVGVNTTVRKELTIDAMFNDKVLFSFVVTYRYVTKPNVAVTANYPMPDGKTPLEVEYIATSQDGSEGSSAKFKSTEIEDFFGSIAPFATAERITTEILAKENGELLDSLSEFWNVSVSNIENVNLSAVVGSTTLTITPTSTNTGIYANSNKPAINLTFEIIDSSKNGKVDFEVVVNGVSKIYSVIVVAGSTVTVGVNAPNYENNQETIYAEDLASQADQNIFTQTRILNYGLNASAQVGATYYARFVNDKNEVRVYSINVTNDNVGQVVNIDLGKTNDAYEYKGTYTTLASAENDVEANKVVDVEVFSSAPKLTGRIVAYYKDGTEINFSQDNVSLLLFDSADASGTGKDAEEVTVGTDAYGETAKKYTVKVKVGSTTIETTGTYSVGLDIEFEVEGNADSTTTYTTIDVLAGTEKSLLEYSRTQAGFAIKNARTGLLYTQESLSASSGSIELEIYGFAGGIGINYADISDSDSEYTKLSKVAGQFHTKLQNTVLESGIRYSTGIMPRAGLVPSKINNITESDGTIKENYITISGVVDSATGKIVDYKINAQGANNDGNHVMMQIRYTVTIGERKITKYHNILFRVLPNSTITFKSKHETGDYTNPSVDRVIGEQSVACNYESPYAITNGSVTFNLWTTDEGDTGSAKSVVTAKMYGSSASSAKSFTYTYTPKVEEGYNDWTSGLTFDGNWKGSASFTSNATTKLPINVGNLPLGTRSFYVDFVNKFGFKARFYFKVTATLNPQIYSTNTDTFTEVGSIAVGARYQSVAPASATSDGYNVIYDSFKYTKYSDQYNNKINITGYENIEKIKLTAVTSTDTYTREINPSNIFEIWTSSAKWGNPADGSKTTLAQDDLNNAQITIELKINGFGEATKLKTYSLKFWDDRKNNELEGAPKLTQSQRMASTMTDPNFEIEGGSAPNYQVTLGGISAYAYANTLGAIDINSVDSTISNIDTIKVKGISFYYNGENIGNCKENTDQTDFASSDNLITNSAVSFVKSNKGITAGTAYDSTNKKFTVPTINGILFGTGTTLSNVKMVITLISSEGNECELSRYVTITRSADSTNLFEENIIDGNSPTRAKKSDGTTLKNSATVYNDTLEITLAKNESISYMVAQSVITTEDDGATYYAYKETQDSDPQTGKTYYTYNNTEKKYEGVTLSTGFETGTSYYERYTPRMTTITNTKNYTTKEYRGITASIDGLEENLKGGSKFYIYMTNCGANSGIEYNGTELSIDLDNNSSIECSIGESIDSDALKMNIENVAEVSGNSKSETLYFLFTNDTSDTTGKYVYQHAQTFKIHTTYKRAQYEDDNYIQVDNYYKLTNGTDSYYVLPIASWTSGIDLYNYNDTKTEYKIANNPYKFHFEINTDSSSGSGSAFVDENGTITTTKDFVVKSHTINVKVYMKVSGVDGKFEYNNSSILLGTFRLYLNPNEPNSKQKDAGVYKLSNREIVVVPNGYQLYATSSTGLDKAYESTENTGKTIAISAGETVDLKKIFDDKFTNATSNKNFHLVNAKATGSVGNGDDIYFNNVNTWTFATAGTFEITVVGVGRDSSGYKTQALTATIIVYETSTKEEIVKYGSISTAYNLAPNYTWYEIAEDGSVSEAEAFTPDKVGIVTKTYIAIDNNQTSKIVTIKYYTYDAGDLEKSVALRSSTTFQLKNLIDTTDLTSVEIYDVSTNDVISKVTSVSFEYGAGSILYRTYLFVTKDKNGNENIKKYSVSFKIVSADVTTLGDYISQDTSLTEKAADLIKTNLKWNNADGKTLTIEEIGTNGILTTASTEHVYIKTTDTSPVSGKTYYTLNGVNYTEVRFNEGEEFATGTQYYELATNVTKNYVATVKNGDEVVGIYRYSINFYVYEQELTIAVDAQANNAYTLSTLNNQVLTATGATGAVSYYEINNATLTAKEIIALEADTEKTYYIKVGDRYFLIKFNFTITTQS